MSKTASKPVLNRYQLPIEAQLWTLEDIAHYLGDYSIDYTKKHILCHPAFPPARPLPTSRDGTRISDRWAAKDIIAFALAYDKATCNYTGKKT